VTDPPSPEEVRQFILRHAGDAQVSSAVQLSDVPPSFDLLLEGVIDSFGVVELITRLEQRFGVEFDLDGLEVDDLTRVGPLSDYVARLAAR
jgi:acyl carrier protein